MALRFALFICTVRQAAKNGFVNFGAVFKKRKSTHATCAEDKRAIFVARTPKQGCLNAMDDHYKMPMTPNFFSACNTRIRGGRT
jgi:hypothetical protein